MTDYERDMAAGGKPVMTDYERDLAAGGKPASVTQSAAPALPAPEPSVGDRILSSFKNAAHTFASGAQAAGQAVRHPLDTITDPSRRREFERGLDDMLTLGTGQKLADYVGRKLGDAPDVQLGATQEADAAKAPGFRAFGNMAVGFAPQKLAGAAGQAMGIGGTVAREALALPVTSGVAGAALGTAKAVAGYEASAPLIAGGQAAVRGDNPIEAAYQAAKDPAGLALAGAAGAVHGAGRGGAAKIRSPKTQTGRDIADIEAAGGKIRPFGDPARGGAFETPEMTKHPLDRAGNVKFAEESAGRSIEHAKARYQAAQDAWGTKADQILSSHPPDEVYKADATHGALKSIDEENTVNGVVGDDKIAKATAKVRQMLTADTPDIDVVASANADKLVYKQAPGGTVSDFMKVRKLVNRLSRHTTEPAERYVFGKVLGAMAEDASQIDPRIGELNAEYKQSMESLSASNDALFGQKRPQLKDTEAARSAAAGRMSRLGDPTQYGPKADVRMERFAAESPENATEAKMMRARKAATRLRYGEPETSTSFEKGIARGAEHGAKKLAGAVLGHAAGGPVGGAIGYGLGHVLQSLPQAKVRLGLPLMEELAQGTGVRAGVMGDQAEQRRAFEILLQARALEADLAARRAQSLQGGR